MDGRACVRSQDLTLCLILLHMNDETFARRHGQFALVVISNGSVRQIGPG